jgi:protein-L-isoaspartate(D-aspartate) O-methyltransferase
MRQDSTRRAFLTCATGALTSFALAANARADVPGGKSYSWDAFPPTGDREDFINWMQTHRGEQPIFLTQRWERYIALRAGGNLLDAQHARAFLLTPREEFVLRRDIERAYESTYLDIGFGSTISGPQVVARMTSALDVHRDDRVLEIGTGSGYQSAYLANLSDRVWTVEIVKELWQRARSVYDRLIAQGYVEYKSIASMHADGYEGWQEAGPFDKIIVTCGIDHVPPPLMLQLKPGGTMVIPIGPPSAHHVMKIAKTQMPNRSISMIRTDIFGGMAMRFVPLKRAEGV